MIRELKSSLNEGQSLRDRKTKGLKSQTADFFLSGKEENHREAVGDSLPGSDNKSSIHLRPFDCITHNGLG